MIQKSFVVNMNHLHRISVYLTDLHIEWKRAKGLGVELLQNAQAETLLNADRKAWIYTVSLEQVGRVFVFRYKYKLSAAGYSLRR